MLLPVLHGADAAAIGAAGAHDDVAELELGVVPHLAALDVEHHRVVHLHATPRVTQAQAAGA